MEGNVRAEWRRCGCKVEVSKITKVIRYGNKRLSYCWRVNSMRRNDNEVQCMIMYVSRDRNMLGEVSE